MNYVEFASGTAHPDGYIAPCEVIKDIPGWVQVLLRPLPPYHRLDWAQWVRKSQLLNENDVTEA